MLKISSHRNDLINRHTKEFHTPTQLSNLLNVNLTKTMFKGLHLSLTSRGEKVLHTMNHEYPSFAYNGKPNNLN